MPERTDAGTGLCQNGPDSAMSGPIDVGSSHFHQQHGGTRQCCLLGPAMTTNRVSLCGLGRNGLMPKRTDARMDLILQCPYQPMSVSLIQTENLPVPATNASSGTTNRAEIDGTDRYVAGWYRPMPERIDVKTDSNLVCQDQ